MSANGALRMAAAMVGGTTAFTSWNPADSNDVTLTNSNLTAALANGVGGAVRSIAAKSSGKWFWEVTVISVDSGGNTPIIGIGTSSASLTIDNPYTGSDAYGWGYYSVSGTKTNNGGGTAYGASYTTNDVIGVALDLTNGTLIFYKNGVSQGTAFSGLSGTFYAMLGGKMGLNGSTVRANFGASAFSYSVPSGYNAGLF